MDVITNKIYIVSQGGIATTGAIFKPVGRFLFWVAFEIDICSLGLAPKDFVAPLIALFGEGWTRCFYSRNWQCRVAALTHLSAIMAQRLEDLPWSTGR